MIQRVKEFHDKSPRWVRIVFMVLLWLIPFALLLWVLFKVYQMFFQKSSDEEKADDLVNSIQNMPNTSPTTVPEATLKAAASELQNDMLGKWMIWDDYEFSDMVNTLQNYGKGDLIEVYKAFGVRRYPYFGLPIGSSGDLFSWFNNTMDSDDYKSARDWWKEKAGL